MLRGVRIGVLATIIGAWLALSLALTASAAPVRFGAKLTTDTQPQPALWCDEPNDVAPHPTCTWVMNEAYGRPAGGHKAPKAGTIGKVRIISCTPGSFRVQVVRQVPGTDTFRAVTNGPVINYQGDPQGCGDEDDFVYQIESIGTSFSVAKGDRIAIRTQQTGALRCGSGGDHTLLFDPPLATGGAARTATEDEGCFLLVEWQYKP
jgi:hypothetical protein